MLRIRDAQMEALRRQRQQDFEDLAVAHVAARTGEDEESVRSAVRSGIRQALDAGLRKESEILRWLDVTRLLQSHPEKAEWAAAISADPELTPSVRLTLIEDGVRS